MTKDQVELYVTAASIMLYAHSYDNPDMADGVNCFLDAGNILGAMKDGYSHEKLIERIKKIREELNDIVKGDVEINKDVVAAMATKIRQAVIDNLTPEAVEALKS